MPFSLGNIILLKEKGGMSESIPRQIDKFRTPQGGERGLGLSKWRLGVWNSQGGKKDKRFFPLHFLVLVNYTTQFKLCTRDYTTMYLAGGVSPS